MKTVSELSMTLNTQITNVKIGAFGAATQQVPAAAAPTLNNISIPIIRNVLPSLIASQIIGVQPMTNLKNSIWNIKRQYNKRYWPYRFTISHNQSSQAEKWCWQHFRGRYWHSDHNKFVFKREEDAVLFRLTWA